jgi:site-specific DNA recombinase
VRVALYARYSSDNQRDASIADQQRVCRAFAERQTWTVAQEYSDHAVSGATLLRSGFQALMRDALNGRFDIVLAESLDRFSRDQEDTAGLFKRLTFAGVRIVTVSEGEIGYLHVGLKGTMNALYLHDLAEKTRRGLRGRVEAGRSGGGLCYGYRVVRALEGQPRGAREIYPEEAALVQRIFQAFAAGVSPKAIAKTLNAEGIRGPMGAAWSPSTIHGHASRGTGILNNELYIGRLVWNRQRYIKHPDTGKRTARLNPPTEWTTKDVPELRIIDDALWQAAKGRQTASRQTMQAGIVRARRPKYLFSGLTKCGECGGGYVLSSRDTLRCFNATARGTCRNTRTMTRQELEGRVLRAMRERFFEPGAFDAFCRAFTEEMNRLRREHRVKVSAAPREIASIERRQKEILNLLLGGFGDVEVFKREVRELEDRRTELTAAIAAAEVGPPLPALHPRMAEVFREKTETLTAALERDDDHDMARQALRDFIDRIVIPPGDGLLQVVGDFGEMLKAAAGRTGAAAVGYVGCGGGI